MLLTKRKDGTGRILSKVLTEQTKASEVLPKKGGIDIFLEQSWASFMTGDLLHDWKIY